MRLFSLSSSSNREGPRRRRASNEESSSSTTTTTTRRNAADEQPRRRSTGDASTSPTAVEPTTTMDVSISKQFMILPLRLRGIDPDNAECPICQEDYVVGCTIAYLPCGHMYHSRCINGWLARRSCNNKSSTCCLCRYELSRQQVPQRPQQLEHEPKLSLPEADEDIQYFNRHFRTLPAKNNSTNDDNATTTTKAVNNPLANTIQATFCLSSS